MAVTKMEFQKSAGPLRRSVIWNCVATWWFKGPSWSYWYRSAAQWFLRLLRNGDETSQRNDSVNVLRRSDLRTASQCLRFQPKTASFFTISPFPHIIILETWNTLSFQITRKSPTFVMISTKNKNQYHV
jgi:hypothetical protein